MEDGRDPLKRKTAPYFWTDSCDKPQREQSPPQFLPENKSENWQFLERENSGFSEMVYKKKGSEMK